MVGRSGFAQGRSGLPRHSSHVAQLWIVRLLRMSRRIYIVIAFVLAILATLVGWSQTFAHKTWPPAHTALWFPLVVFANSYGGAEMIVLSFIQFPLFAILFVFGVRRWRVAVVSSVLGFIYALMAGIAFMMVSSR